MPHATPELEQGLLRDPERNDLEAERHLAIGNLEHDHAAMFADCELLVGEGGEDVAVEVAREFENLDLASRPVSSHHLFNRYPFELNLSCRVVCVYQ